MKTANNICEYCFEEVGCEEAQDPHGNTLWVGPNCAELLASQTAEREGDRQYERDFKS